MNHPNKQIMQKAIELAQKESSVAALIVKGDEIIAHGLTTVKQAKQAFRHAEINAIEEASKKLQSYYLSGCWLYTTFEPCPMCAAACVWAKLEGIVFGASMEDRTEHYTQRILIPCETVLKHGDPTLKVYKEFMRAECKKLLH
jgi:tRNA(adenine34) deaminase